MVQILAELFPDISHEIFDNWMTVGLCIGKRANHVRTSDKQSINGSLVDHVQDDIQDTKLQDKTKTHMSSSFLEVIQERSR